MGLSVIGGFLGLDHIYLRSPVTAVFKFIVNVFCFGLWWLYDALQAVFHSDTVRLYGLGIPGWGPFGIGSGVLSRATPDKKHYRFLIYTASLFVGGMFGLDSFILGDRQTGIIRLLCLISLIFSPIAFAWWAYGIFQYFTNTEELINDNHVFFGAPYRSAADRLRSRFPLLGFLFSPIEMIKSIVNNIFGPALFKPLTNTAQAAMDVVDHAVSTVDNTVKLGQSIVSEGSKIVEEVGKTIDTVSQATTVMPGASLYSIASTLGESASSAPSSAPPSASPSAPSSAPPSYTASGGKAETFLGKQENLNPLGYALLGTLSVISLLGLFVTGYRFRNGARTKSSRNDTPPQPGVSGATDSKESPSAP
jgi:TM2 domain-containing membrane protein YozV